MTTSDTDLKEKDNTDNNNSQPNNETEQTLKNESQEIDNNNKESHKNENKKEQNQELEKLKKKSPEKLAKEILKLRKELEERSKESESYLDKYKRALADVDNIRKRSIIDKQDSLKYGNFKLIEDLLVILDDFQRAIDHAKTTENMDITVFTEGIEMIEKQFIDLLFKKYGVEKFGEDGEEFNPSLHKAMMMEEGHFDTEVILQVFRKGYILHGRVIRPAEVKIGKPE